MTTTRQVSMADDAIDEFLGARQTAVISLSDGDSPYAVPITYRFDPDERTFYFRLVYAPGSEKRRFLPDVPEARLVVYEEDDPTYQSVIAVGAPAEVDTSTLSPEEVTQFGKTSRPLFEMWQESKANLDVRLYELDPDRITGRRITAPDE